MMDGKDVKRIDMSNYIDGMYLLTILDESGQKLGTFKILVIKE